MFGIYLEGWSGGCFTRTHITAKTLKGLDKKTKAYQERFEIANVGHVTYKILDSDRKYDRESYQILEQYNAKVFFEYWD